MIRQQQSIKSVDKYYTKQRRTKTSIQVPRDKISQYFQTTRGNKQQTKLLNINLKTLTLGFLKDMECANQLSDKAIALKKQFQNMPPSFQSFSFLFFGPQLNSLESPDIEQKQAQRDFSQGNPLKKKHNVKKIQQEEQAQQQLQEIRCYLRKQCSNFYRSSLFVKKILGSSRMFLKNKIVILKFLMKIEDLGHLRFQQKKNQWKNVIRF